MNKHITFDLETLGNSYNAPIVQIGAVKFEQSGVVTDTFECNINWNTLKKYEFEIDYSTVAWWMRQEEDAVKSVLNQEGAIDIKKALNKLRQWIGDLKEYNYWSHATFDAVILANACRKVGIDVFIPFRQQRDIRTLNFLVGKVEVKREGIAHTALDDAKFQANYISEMLKRLKQQYDRENKKT